MSKEKTENIPVTTNKETAKTTWPAIHPIAEMERFFNHFLGHSRPSIGHWHDTLLQDNLFGLEGQRLPSLDVIDRDNEILVRAEIPGIEKKDLSISLTDNLLTIKGQSSSEEKEEKGDYHRHEISRFSFARSVALPGAADASKTAASLKNGMLEINLPKLESSKRRNITVK